MFFFQVTIDKITGKISRSNPFFVPQKQIWEGNLSIIWGGQRQGAVGGTKGQTKGTSAGVETVFSYSTMRTFRNSSRAKISICSKMETTLACYWDLEPELLWIDLHPKQIKPFTACAEVIRLFGSVKFGI
jgi:hypothetical protein